MKNRSLALASGRPADVVFAEFTREPLAAASIAEVHAARLPSGEEWGTGIAFGQSGNYYGNNQMAASTPFALGQTTQTDWGGNVGF